MNKTLDSEFCELELSGKSKVAEGVLVDREDLVKCVEFGKWRLTPKGYVVAVEAVEGEYKTMTLHRFVFGTAPEGYEIDHINRNKLDNRKANLRYVTKSENLLNRDPFMRSPEKHPSYSQGYRGIEINRTGKYRGYIAFNKKRYRTKLVSTPREAALAYNELALKIRGDKAILNIL